MMTAAVFLALAPMMVLTAFFSIEVAAGLLPMSGRRSTTASTASAVVIIPAHDEAEIIDHTLRQLQAALSSQMRILVVADNCADATATRARAACVEVIERSDPSRRGKAYALAFALEWLATDPPDVVVVIDADCTLDRDSLQVLVDRAAASGRPCQAVNLLQPDRTANPLVQISSFAFMIKNLVRQRGLQRLAARVHLTGTGMAIPSALLASSLVASGDIVEDLSLGLELSARGFPPQLCPDALVSSSAAPIAETLTQRRRWEGGFIATSLRKAPSLMIDAIRSGDLRSMIAALDLMIPPLALLMLLNICSLAGVAIIVAVLGLSFAPLALDIILLAIAAVLVLAAWIREGRKIVSLGALARIPVYVAWKIPLYLSLAWHGAPREWLRIRR